MRRLMTLAVSALLANVCLSQVRAEQNGQRSHLPNIIFIMADDLGYGDLGCYGQEQIKTPNIDKLAAEGMRFTNAYAGSTVCAPSRCVLMTGKHTGQCLIRGNARYPLRPEDVTVAEVLKRAGYSTGLVGKWGLGEEGSVGIPTKQGFDTFFGYLNQRHAHNYYPDFLWENEEKIQLPNEVKPARGPDDLGGVATRKVAYSHDLFAARALGFIDEHKDEPFFLYLALTIPHANNEAGNKGQEVPDYGQYADKDWPEPQKGTAAMISRMDGDIGTLIEKLKAHRIDRNTIVFFTSDNGPHREGGNNPDFFNSNGPLQGIKRSLHDGGVRVPFIVWAPGVIKPDTTSNAVVMFDDFLPTAAALAGVNEPPHELPQGLTGQSILPATQGGDLQKRPLYWEFFEGKFAQAVRYGKWKFIRYNENDATAELYDITQDIGEQNDLAADNPEVVKQMIALIDDVRTENPYWKTPREKMVE